MNSPLANQPRALGTASRTWLAQTAKLCEVRPEIKGVTTYQLEWVDPQVAATYRFRPGQFNMLYMPGTGEAAMSLSGDPSHHGTLVHTVRAAGNVTHALAALQPGQTLGVRGPFGSSWPIEECVGRDVVVVAGGTGLAPLRPVVYELTQQQRQYGRLHLLYGARSPETRLYLSEYESWEREGMMVQTTVDRSQPGYKGNIGVVPLLLERLQAFDPRTAMLFICGPEVIMRYIANTAFERGMSASQIYVSMERNMQCAVGLCGHCQLGPEFLCKDGPVFRYDRIAPYLHVEGL